MSFPNVADLSSAQSSFDASAYAASGRTAVIIKATEGTGYHFVTGDVWEAHAHDEGLTVGRYHYMGDSLHGVLHPPVDEARWFLQCVGPHSPGRFAICDTESPLHGPYLYGMSAQQAADWTGTFLDTTAAEGWPGVGYSMVGSGVIQKLKAPYLRWYAAYPGPVPSDRALHQFTDNGPVPGVGNCDDSLCFVDLAVFSGVFPITPQEDDVLLMSDNSSGKVYLVGGFGKSYISDPPTLGALTNKLGAVVPADPADLARIPDGVAGTNP